MPGLFGASAAVMRVCRLPDPTPPHGYESTREAAMAGVVVRPLRRRDVRIAVLGFWYGLNLLRRVSDGKALTDIPALFDSNITEF